MIAQCNPKDDIARVKLNGKDLGVVWFAPWRNDVSSAIVEGNNKVEIEVANRWINRLPGPVTIQECEMK